MISTLRVVLIAFVLSLAMDGARAAAPARTRVTKASLGKLLAYYQSITTLSTRFKETKRLGDLALELTSEGTLTVHRPERVVWEIVKPSPVVVTLDRKQIRVETGTGASKKVETVSVDAGGEKASLSLRNLVAWLKLDPEELSARYEIFAVGEHDYEFVPKDKTSTPFESLTMTMKQEGYVEKLLIREKAGDSIAIAFEKPRIEHRR